MEEKKRPPKKGPPKDLPDVMPPACVIAIFVGSYCEEPGPRHLLLNNMLRDAKQKGKDSLADWKTFVSENWLAARAAYQEKTKNVET
jgi:hypothetical protein